ncbi:MAG: acyl-CoA carboxylase subunit epsilon [Streptosporangiales bacterium]|nr:acyl-CoA carboxylase subunit epsilon [Streptosporangiales bacterium]
MSAGAGEQPVLRVVRGDPSPEELVALVAVVTARSAPSAAPVRRSAWRDSGRGTRGPLPHGPGAWRRSGQPR